MSGEPLDEILADRRERRDAGAAEERLAVVRWLREVVVDTPRERFPGNDELMAAIDKAATALVKDIADRIERGEHRGK